jgi:hypothetical protein
LATAWVLALPAGALAQKSIGRGGGAPAVHAARPGGFSAGNFGGRSAMPMRSFTPHVGNRSFNVNRGAVHVNKGVSFNRSIRTQSFTRSNTERSTLRNTTRSINGTRALRTNRLTTANQTLQQGRFATRFATTASTQRIAGLAAHRAWRRGWRAGFVPWYGPIFWPYAYSDIFDYAFWPFGYDDGFWFVAYDNFFDGVFWGDGLWLDDNYAYTTGASARARATYAGVQQLCTQPGSGITAWPFADIERKVGPNDEQKQLLGDVRKAASDAAATFKASCPAENAFPMTPPGRLQMITARLQGTLDAVHIVRPALTKFYDSLNDEQKERFNAIGPKRPETNAEARAALPQTAKACREAKPGLANLPIERIRAVVKPTDAQQDGLKQLQDATNKAVGILQDACPEEVPLTPSGRLEAMEKRLQAIIEAANTVKPALENFYASLSSEQKARFNRIGRELLQTAG